MSTFKVTPTDRRTGNTAPYFYSEGKTESEAAKNAVGRSSLFRYPNWKPVLLESKRKESRFGKRRSRD